MDRRRSRSAETLLARSAALTWTSTESISNAVGQGYAPQTFAHATTRIPPGTRIATKYTTGRAYKGAIVFGVPYT